MAKKKKLRLGQNGPEVDATEVAITGSQEFWNTYLLEDGTQVRIKVVVKSILRIDGTYDPEGNPSYVIKSQNVTDVDAPDTLRKKT